MMLKQKENFSVNSAAYRIFDTEWLLEFGSFCYCKNRDQ
jgi:hypothetical protein